jgi:hypothetical protein
MRNPTNNPRGIGMTSKTRQITIRSNLTSGHLCHQ